MNWKDRQRSWKTKLVNDGVKQKEFCAENDICEVSFSSWVSGRVRANPENELKIEKILEDLK